MSIPDHILETIQTTPEQAALSACEYALEAVEQSPGWGKGEHEQLLEAYALISAMEDANLIRVYASVGNIDGDRPSACVALSEYLNSICAEMEQELANNRLQAMKSKFANIVSNGFSYEFTEGDVNRIQVLINELRTLISDNTELEDQHKRRLLKRLEKLQSEMHKKMSDLDHFYGLTVEGSVMLKKVGGNLKPIVDRISEITKITWATQSRAEDLPSGSEPPLLGHDGDSHSIE
ncbi:hypothetical protein TZ03_24830 [Pseudomonas sp. 10-1B]|uniref:hypothetical protein n=1 Tax=Pseudomonas sp. 10-1B TaxID=1546029 RepID=UPI00061EFCE8|nr:hypothetical protein [Pseudomonas sp. 10-1B]KIY38013.1 hypothetical protein TZ03_24830 [Pseudomonas sp. 10-1B]